MKTVRRPDAVLRAMIVVGWRLPSGTLAVNSVAHLSSNVHLGNLEKNIILSALEIIEALARSHLISCLLLLI